MRLNIVGHTAVAMMMWLESVTWDKTRHLSRIETRVRVERGWSGALAAWAAVDPPLTLS